MFSGPHSGCSDTPFDSPDLLYFTGVALPQLDDQNADDVQQEQEVQLWTQDRTLVTVAAQWHTQFYVSLPLLIPHSPAV
jgi:hypothetical protein